MVYLHGNEAALAIPLIRSCHLAVYSRVNYKKMASTAIRRRNS